MRVSKVRTNFFLESQVEVLKSEVGTLTQLVQGFDARMQKISPSLQIHFDVVEPKVDVHGRELESHQVDINNLKVATRGLYTSFDSWLWAVQTTSEQLAHTKKIGGLRQPRLGLNGMVLGVGRGMGQVIAQVGSLGREVQQQKYTAVPSPHH